jgi:hypothetical protein
MRTKKGMVPKKRRSSRGKRVKGSGNLSMMISKIIEVEKAQ